MAATKQFGLWATVIRFIDGDTFVGVLDHGCRIYTGRPDKPVRFRCAAINTPELPSPEAVAAREFAAQIAPPGEYPCVSTGLDEYGRPLLDLRLADGRMFSAVMLASGHAERYR